MKSTYENGDVALSPPPRLTTFLRYHSNISKTPQENGDYDIAKILATKRDEKRRHIRECGASWTNFKRLLEELGQKYNVNLQSHVRNIDEIAQAIAPEPDASDEVALLLFTLSYMYEVLPNRHRLKVERVVGEVDPSFIKKAHEESRNMAALVGLEELEEALENLQASDKSVPMFGQHIKVGSITSRPELRSSSKLLKLKCGKPKGTPAGLSLNFEDYSPPLQPPGPLDQGGSQPKIKEAEVYDRSWVEAEMLKYYTDIAIISEMANVTLSLLLGSKSNIELENELFDFLGFDRFELIQTLLTHREDLKSYIPDKEHKTQELRDVAEEKILQ